MGNLITLSRPPRKACGECPFCPSTPAEVVPASADIYIGYDEYIYYVQSDSNDYNLSDVEFFKQSSAFTFYWKDAPVIGDCSAENGWALSYFYGNNQNSRLGFILYGEVGSTITISLPYYGYSTDYTVSTSTNRTTCTISESNENLGQIGTIEIELEISAEDVLYTNADGTVVAGINATASQDEDTGELVNIAVGTNADFALPQPPTNTTYYFENIDYAL